MTTIEFVFDFASPNAYLAYRAMPPILDRTGATLKLTPCLLGGIFKATGNQAPMMAFAKVKGKLQYERLEMQRFIGTHQLTRFRMNPHFPVNTLLMMRAALVAQARNELMAYVEAGLSLMWEQGEKMDEPAVFLSTLTDAGFDAQALLDGAQTPTIKQQLMENTAEAVDRGCFGIPTFFVGDEMYFGKERLAQLERAAARGAT